MTNVATSKKEILPSSGPSFAAAFLAATGVDYKAAGLTFGIEMSNYGGNIVNGPLGSATEHAKSWTGCRRLNVEWRSDGSNQWHSVELFTLRDVVAFVLGQDDGPKGERA